MNKTNLYFLPASADALKDKVFAKAPYRGGVSDFPVWFKMKEAAEKLGIEMHTYDYWQPQEESNDVLLVQNHPGETLPWRIFYRLKHWENKGGFMLERQRWFFKNYKFFKKRILAQCESPMVVPFVYKNWEKMKKDGLYDKTFIFTHYFNYTGQEFISSFFDNPKTKFLVMINTNARPHGLRNEFYGERLKAVRYFCDSGDFDLYGYRWDQVPKHPFYFHYKKYVQKVWRGTVSDKMKTLSEYKFTLCFENCAYPGYISEKIFDCLAAGSIPIYLGAPDIDSIVPKSCFIDFRKFSGYAELNQFLRGLSEESLKEYQNAIHKFITNTSNYKPIEEFVKEIVGW